MKNKMLTFIHNNLAKPKVRMWLLVPVALYIIVLSILLILQGIIDLDIEKYTPTIYFGFMIYLAIVIILNIWNDSKKFYIK